MKSRRARLVPAVAAVLALGLTAGCGSSDSSDGAEGDGASKPETSSSEPGGEAGQKGEAEPEPGDTSDWPKDPAEGKLSEDELSAYALAQGDIQGFTVRIPSEEELSGMGAEKAKEKKCEPLGAVMAGTPQPEPSDLVYRSVISEVEEENPSGLILFETLAAYEAKDADALFSKLRASVKDCADGFETTAKGHEGIGKYTGVKQLKKPDLKGADDVLAYQLDGDAEGQRLPILFNVVRTDSTVAVFYAMNLMSPEEAVIPDAIVQTQTTKLNPG